MYTPILFGALTSPQPPENEKQINDEKTKKKTENYVSNATIGRHT
jgi:hypothetical protein